MSFMAWVSAACSNGPYVRPTPLRYRSLRTIVKMLAVPMGGRVRSPAGRDRGFVHHGCISRQPSARRSSSTSWLRSQLVSRQPGTKVPATPSAARRLLNKGVPGS